MDPRDINKVQEVIGYVEKFVRHNRGDHNRALNHMVNSLVVCSFHGDHTYTYMRFQVSCLLWFT